MIKDYQQRVLDEYYQLADRIDKLELFFLTEVFKLLEYQEKRLLEYQVEHMNSYAHILEARLARWGIDSAR